MGARKMMRPDVYPKTGIAAYLVRLYKSAGAKSESSYGRDGFLSYHAESHALGMGMAAGFVSMAYGDAKLLGFVYAAAVYGKAQESNQQRRRIFVDIKQEPHYALAGLVFGAVLGLIARLVMGEGLPSLSIPV